MRTCAWTCRRADRRAGVTDARQGLADIGMLARALKPDETSLHATPIARDGVCIIVNRTNPVPALTDDQIVRMYTSGVSNWKQVGGPDLPITLIHMTDGRASWNCSWTTSS